jgi:hypothetical protein
MIWKIEAPWSSIPKAMLLRDLMKQYARFQLNNNRNSAVSVRYRIKEWNYPPVSGITLNL